MSHELLDPACRSVQSALPWYASGQLPEAECAAIALHLRDCAECRADLAEEERLGTALADTGSVEIAPQAAMRRFFERLDGLDAPPSGVPAPPARRAWRLRIARPALAALAATQAVVFLAAGIWFGARNAERDRPAYVTESAPHRLASGPRLRVVADARVPLADFEALLGRLGAEIVAGPSEARVYTLALPENLPAQDLQARLAMARADPAVTFAEPLVAVSGR